MNEGYILSIDCGTQSARVLIFDIKGSLLCIEKETFEPYFSSYPGWAEQDPEIYWHSIGVACKKLKEKNEELWDKIIGITLTTQRDTVINLDKEGKVLRPAMVWLDQRMAKCEDAVPKLDSLVYKSVGMLNAIEVSRRKSKANWIKENQMEIWEKTYKYLLLSGYLTYKLCGKMIDSSASQIAHIPFNYKTQNWPNSFTSFRWRMFGIEKDKLPELIQPGLIMGQITEDAEKATGIKKGIPVIACGSDKGCETVGTGCLNVECASLSFGTTATIQTTSDSYVEPIKFMPSYPAIIPGCFNPELEIFRGYWMISWFKKEFCAREMVEAEIKNISPEVLLNERLNDIAPGCQGLILQPFWGPGLKMPSAKGSIIGFGDVHTRAHIYRAIVEGINFGLMEGIEKIEAKTKVRVKKLTVSGGGSQSDAICQITSDMFNLPVCKERTYETSGLGAAMCGYVGLGIYKSFDEAVDNMIHYINTFEPNEANVKIYRKLFNSVYKKIYPGLEGVYREIQKITGYPEIY